MGFSTRISSRKARKQGPPQHWKHTTVRKGWIRVESATTLSITVKDSPTWAWLVLYLYLLSSLYIFKSWQNFMEVSYELKEMVLFLSHGVHCALSFLSQFRWYFYTSFLNCWGKDALRSMLFCNSSWIIHEFSSTIFASVYLNYRKKLIRLYSYS